MATKPKVGQIAATKPRFEYVDVDRSQLTGARFYDDSPVVAETEAPEAPGMLRRLGDTAVQFGQGVVTGGKMMSDVFGANNAVSSGLSNVNQALDGLLSATAQNDKQKIAQIMQEAEGKGWGEQIIAGLKAAGVDPVGLAANALGTSLPTMATMLIPGAGPAAVTARMGAGVAMGAGQGVGAVKGQIYDETKRKWQESGATPEQAEAKAQEAAAYGGENTDQIAIGGVLGMGSVLGAERALGKVLHGAGKAGPGMLGRVATTTAAETGTEMLQGGQEKFATNTALNRQGFDVDPMSGVIANATLEGAAAAPMGAIAGIPRPAVAAAPGIDPAKEAADAIRNIEKVPESGALTKAVNAGVEAKAQAIEAGAPLVDEQAIAEPEPVDDPVRDQILALPDGARQDALRAYAVVNRTDVAKGVQQYNRKLLDRLLAENQPKPVLGDRLTDTDMGAMLGGGGMMGNADPLMGALGMNREAQANSITNVAQAAESRPPMPASDAARMLDEARNRGLDLAVVEHPAGGFVLVPPNWVTPDMAAQGEQRLNETIARMQQADAAPVERAPRTRTDGVGLDLQTDPVQNYLDSLRSVNTPAARAYVRDFDAGRITPADVQQRMQAERGLTPEQRIARAAAEAPAQTDPVADRLARAAAQGMATPAPTDILNPSGEPFKTRMAADRAAKKTPGAVVPVDGGFVVRPQEPVNVQDVPQAPEAPQAAPVVSQPAQAQEAVGTQPAAPAPGPAEGAGAVEAAGVERSKLLASLDQAGATREMVLDIQLKDAQYRLAQITATTGILPADRASRLSAINQEIADLNAVRSQARELDERDRREGNTRSMLHGARQELDAAVRAGAITPEAAKAVASNAKNTGNAADASDAIFAAVDLSTTGVARESQAPEAQQAVSQQPQAGGQAIAGPAAPAAAQPAALGGNGVQAAGLTNAAQTQNPGAQQSSTAAGAQAQTQGAAWDGLDPQQRTAVLSKAGWITNKGGLNVIGKRLLNTSWEQITGGTREIIARNIENEQGVAATADVQEPPSRTSNSRYELPPEKSAQQSAGDEWMAAQSPSFKPTERQQLLMDAVAKALDDGAFYNSDVDEHVAKTLGVTKEQRARNSRNVEGGDFGYDVYNATRAVKAQRGNAKSREFAKALNLKPGDVLGTLVFNDGKVTTGVKVVDLNESGLIATITGKRGAATLNGEVGVDAIASAIDRAKERGKRSDGYAEFVESKVAPIDAAQQAPAATEPVAQPITRADVTAAQQQATALIAERIDAMTAGEVNTIARRFLPTMGVKPTVSKERNKVAVTDFTKVSPIAAANEFGVTLPADVRRALDAEFEGVVGESLAAAKQEPGGDAQLDSAKLTQSEAKALMAWQDLGQKDGVKTHILTFYESQADKDAKRGRMTVATVSMGDRSATAWTVDGDDKTFGALSLAKKRAEGIGMAKAVADGFVERLAAGREVVDTSRDQRIGKDINGNDVFMGTDGALRGVPYIFDERGRPKTGVAMASAKAAAPAATIEDAGEKIGGARKDRWKERGLNLDDLDAMTEAEGAELATKANVWKPEYEALSGASEPVTAAMVKTIYDQLAAKPKKNTPEGRRQYVQMMRIVRDVLTEAKGPDAVRNAYLEIRKRAGLNTMDPKAKEVARGLLFSVYKGRSDPFVLGGADLMKAKKMVEDGFPAKAAPWKSRLTVGRREGGNGVTERGIEMYMELSADVGTPLSREQIEAGFFRVVDKQNKTVAFAPTKEDAEAAAETVYERDLKGKKDSKPEPVRPNLDELKRENLPRRIDRDVTADDFVKDLGFRGIEFGNWSAQDERQRILNMAYDGLMDLAEIMGVPPKAMSLNGTLGMAFGARGGGRFAAHYEPGKLVINMTKIRGGGSMAHEWAHALDHYFGELDKADAYTTQARGASGWYSEDQYNGVPRKRMERVGNEWKNVEKMRLDNLRPEMAAAFDEVMRALFQKQITKAEMVRSQELDLERTEALARSEQDAEMKAMYQNMVQNKREALNELRNDPDGKLYAGRGRSDYAKQAQALSGKSVDGYWVRPTEMFARAFESWVFDRVTAMGARSDYLVHGVEEDRFAGGAYKGNPYPTGEERARINAAFDKLAGTIKTKQTDKGVAMFSRAGAQSDNATDSTSRAWYDRFVSLLPETYRNDPHRREPLPAEDWNVQRAAEVRGKVEALNKQLRGENDRKGYGPISIDGLGNLQVSALQVSVADLDGPIKALAKELGAGIAVTKVRKADIQALQRNGFVLEMSLAPVADRLMGRPFVAPANAYAGDAGAQGTIMTYKPRGFPAVLFARDAATPPADSNARNAATQLLVDGLKAKWTRAPEIIVARNMQDTQIPQAVRDYDATLKSQGATGEARGFIYKGKVYLLSDQLKGPEQIAEVLFHEVLGHYGLRGAFGDSLNSILQQMGTMRRRDVVAKAREYGLFDSDALGGLDKDAASDAQIWAAMSPKDRLSAAEEVLAEMAQSQPTIGFVQRAIAAIRNWLRANVPGFNKLALTDADIVQAYILPARGYVTRSQETGAQSLERAMRDAGFSRAPTGDQTQTENFRRWFGDSKVVDADGKPLRVYHGSSRDIEIFAAGADEAGQSNGNRTGAWGSYFTPSAAEASIYAEIAGGDSPQNVVPVYLAIRNPYVMNRAEWGKHSQRTAKAATSAEGRADAKAVRAGIEALGHDGIVIRDRGFNDEWVAFRPEQIKSAIGNNGNFDPSNPDIRFSRAAVSGMASKARDELANAAGAAIKSVTATNIKQRAGFKLTDYMGLGLQALGRRQIVDIYGDMVPLAEYNTLVTQMEADKNEGGAEADKLVKRWAELPEEGKLADLMHEATLAQIDPAKPYVGGDDKAKYAMLAGRFNALSQEAKQVYTDTRDAYQAHHAKVRSAIKERIERSELKGPRKAELLKQMDDEFFAAVKGVYFPLARFGQYAVTVKGPDGKVESVSRAETKAEAEALRNNLLSAFPRDKGFTVGRVMLSKDFIADRDAVGRGFMTELYQVLDKQDMDAAQRAELEDTLGQLYLSSLPDLSWAKHGIHRKGTPGFSQDARRAYAQNMFHGARYLAKLRYSDLMQDELAAMQKHVDDWREVEDFDQNSAQRVVDEMNKRHESLMNPKSNPLSTALTSLGFVFHLGLSPASAMVNLSQTALVAYPIMGAKWGFGKASAALLKASAEAAKGKNDITGSLNADERAAYDEAVRAGTIDVTMAHDLAGIAQGEDAGVMWKIRPVMRYASFLFHHAERFNRQVTFVAAYRLAREAGADHKAAFEQATKATYDGHFDYGACVDDATEILTATGWKKRADLKVGDIAIATDASGRAVESKVLAVNVYEGDREVIEFKSKNRFSMVLTPNHDAVIQSYNSRDKKWQDVRKVRADSLKQSHFILRTPLAPLEKPEGIYGDDFAALLGWIAAEGWYSKYRKTTAATDVRIGQSVTHNPEYVAEIRGILERLGGEFKEYTYQRSRDVLTTFVLRRSLGRRIQECLPEKVLTPELVKSMSTSEMRAFLMAFLKGDGTKYETGRAWAVGQKNGANLDLLQAMATMCGMRATLSQVNGNGVAVLYVVPEDTGARSHVRPLEQIRRTEPLVWCPTTEHGTWIARRNGAVFVTGNSNRPRIMQGNVAKVLLLFKQYGQNMVYTLSRNAYQSIKGTDAEKAEARKALAGLLTSHAMAAGVLGLPMVSTLLAAASMIGGDDDEPWDAKVALQNMLADTFGQKPAEVLAHGLSRLTPWDISSRVGLDKLIFPDVQEGLEGQRLGEAAMAAALGPVAGIGINVLKGLQDMSQGQYARGLEAMMPAALRGPIKAIRYESEGVQDKTGVVIKDDVSLAGVAGQFLGFSPSEVRNATEGKSAVIQQDRALGERRQELLTKAARATMAKDAEARAEAMKEIQRFNQKNPTRRITPLNVLQSVRNRQKRIDQAEGGVYLPKSRRDAMNAGRFALGE